MTSRDRRALTQARQQAPVLQMGSPRAAAGLARALDLAGVGEDTARRFTQGFHSYPARMHPVTAKRALEAAELRPGATLLDPFCGSGTVIVEGLRLGARTLGIDANPLAVAIAAARTGRAPDRLVERARRIAALVVQEGKAARRAGWEPPPPRPGSSSERLKGLFAPHIRRELEALARAVAEEADPALRPIFLTILSSILVKVSKRRSDTAEATVERKLARGMAARLFAARAEELAAGLAALHAEIPRGTPPPDLRTGDARALPFAQGSVDVILSSPPYAGTYDYLEHHALRLAFLGIDARRFAETEIGARRGFADVGGGLAAWERDLGRALAEMRRVLRPGGRALLLVGDSLAGPGRAARAVLADQLVDRLARSAGFDVVARASQRRPPLGAAERTAFTPREKREHLILLEVR